MAKSIFKDIDMSDPCAVWPVLEKAYLQMMTGEQVVRARFGNDETTFSAGSSLQLKQKIAELKAACQAKQTGRRARRAFKAGFR